MPDDQLQSVDPANWPVAAGWQPTVDAFFQSATGVNLLDFLRRRLKRKNVEADFSHAVEKALSLAKSTEANFLPGWCGPTDE